MTLPTQATAFHSRPSCPNYFAPIINFCSKYISFSKIGSTLSELCTRIGQLISPIIGRLRSTLTTTETPRSPTPPLQIFTASPVTASPVTAVTSFAAPTADPEGVVSETPLPTLSERDIPQITTIIDMAGNSYLLTRAAVWKKIQNDPDCRRRYLIRHAKQVLLELLPALGSIESFTITASGKKVEDHVDILNSGLQSLRCMVFIRSSSDRE